MIDQPGVQIDDQIRSCLAHRRPVVALESAVLTHGLPAPQNLQALQRMDRAIRDTGATPALCLIDQGSLWIGASYERAAAVAGDPHRVKATARDLGASMARRLPAGLTVSATLVAAGIAGIQTFATGGIGGVHRDAAQSGDISSDLLQLTRSPVITVCSGAKSVLDLSRTLEYLETAGVPVFAYRSEEFPAFFLRTSGIPCAALDSPLQIAQVARLQWGLGSSSALVIGNPLPAEHAIDVEMWERWSATAHRDAQENNIRGKAVTPYLLDHVARASQGETVRANLVLLEANARLAAEIAIELLR